MPRNYYKKIPDAVISQAKQANLIDYMLTNHPLEVINRYGIRDQVHDSLVLYPHTYCRYSNMEVNDGIRYLEKYQGYLWRDAVLCLKDFYLENYDKPGTPAFNSGYKKERGRFFRPVATNHTDLITGYLHKERGISPSTINRLIRQKKIYPATAAGYGDDFVCFANDDLQFYTLRNISSEGMQKLLFTKQSEGFWLFSSRSSKPSNDLAEYMERLINPYPESLPLYICESPIDAVSLYELRQEQAIYVAMCGLKPNAASNAIGQFAIHKEGDTHNYRKVILAVDNDKAGHDFINAYDGHFDSIFPVNKDWNEDLLKLV